MERERDGQAYSSSPPATSAFGPLCEDVAELGVVLVLVHVMYADVSVWMVLSANVDMPRFWGDRKKRTFAGYRVWGICALGRDRTDTRSRGTGARDRV